MAPILKVIVVLIASLQLAHFASISATHGDTRSSFGHTHKQLVKRSGINVLESEYVADSDHREKVFKWNESSIKVTSNDHSSSGRLRAKRQLEHNPDTDAEIFSNDPNMSSLGQSMPMSTSADAVNEDLHDHVEGDAGKNSSDTSNRNSLAGMDESLEEENEEVEPDTEENDDEESESSQPKTSVEYIQHKGFVKKSDSSSEVNNLAKLTEDNTILEHMSKETSKNQEENVDEVDSKNKLTLSKNSDILEGGVKKENLNMLKSPVENIAPKDGSEEDSDDNNSREDKDNNENTHRVHQDESNENSNVNHNKDDSALVRIGVNDDGIENRDKHSNEIVSYDTDENSHGNKVSTKVVSVDHLGDVKVMSSKVEDVYVNDESHKHNTDTEDIDAFIPVNSSDQASKMGHLKHSAKFTDVIHEDDVEGSGDESGINTGSHETNDDETSFDENVMLQNRSDDSSSNVHTDTFSDEEGEEEEEEETSTVSSHKSNDPLKDDDDFLKEKEENENKEDENSEERPIPHPDIFSVPGDTSKHEESLDSNEDGEDAITSVESTEMTPSHDNSEEDENEHPLPLPTDITAFLHDHVENENVSGNESEEEDLTVPETTKSTELPISVTTAAPSKVDHPSLTYDSSKVIDPLGLEKHQASLLKTVKNVLQNNDDDDDDDELEGSGQYDYEDSTETVLTVSTNPLKSEDTNENNNETGVKQEDTMHIKVEEGVTQNTDLIKHASHETTTQSTENSSEEPPIPGAGKITPSENIVPQEETTKYSELDDREPIEEPIIVPRKSNADEHGKLVSTSVPEAGVSKQNEPRGEINRVGPVSINEPGIGKGEKVSSDNSDEETSTSSTGSFIVLGAIMAVIVVLLGYSVIRSRRQKQQKQQARRQPDKNEKGTELKELLPERNGHGPSNKVVNENDRLLNTLNDPEANRMSAINGSPTKSNGTGEENGIAKIHSPSILEIEDEVKSNAPYNTSQNPNDSSNIGGLSQETPGHVINNDAIATTNGFRAIDSPGSSDDDRNFGKPEFPIKDERESWNNEQPIHTKTKIVTYPDSIPKTPIIIDKRGPADGVM